MRSKILLRLLGISKERVVVSDPVCNHEYIEPKEMTAEPQWSRTNDLNLARGHLVVEVKRGSTEMPLLFQRAA